MKKLKRQILFSYTINTLLLVCMLFLAVYFFIGRNLPYMVYTQQAINGHVIELISDLAQNGEITERDTTVILRETKKFNIGVSYWGPDKLMFSQEINEHERILRLEFIGTIIEKETVLEDGKGRISLTYFRPFLAEDDTVKFFPAFLRLALVLSSFSIFFATIISLANAGLVRRDINKARIVAANLVRGSCQEFEQRTYYVEVGEILEELSRMRVIFQKNEQLKKRMTSDFAHELRTPLTNLQTHLEALIDGVWEPTRERFVSCHEEILRLIRLVADLEKLSKYEDGSVVLQKNEFDITEMVRNICINFQGELKNRDISLVLKGDSQKLFGDKDKLGQVMVNLLSNSLKYTPPKGKILINISGGEEYIYLVVNDSGIGIPVRDLPNVFDRLYRTDLSRNRGTGGSGIGLTIARSIIEAHNGSIDVVSQEGMGTEVTVILPRGDK